MAGTLTTSTGAATFRFLNGRRLSTPGSIESPSNVYISNRNAPKASLHAVIGEPLVESMKMKSMSLYQVLSIKRNATPSEIKSAYRSLAKRYHPDASGSKQNDDRDFIDIHNAYVTLSDPTARALYDLKLSTRFYGGPRWETDQCW